MLGREIKQEGGQGELGRGSSVLNRAVGEGATSQETGRKGGRQP